MSTEPKKASDEVDEVRLADTAEIIESVRPAAESQLYPLNDMGAARYFLDCQQNRMKFDHASSLWLQWDGDHWRYCKKKQERRVAIETAESMVKWARDLPEFTRGEAKKRKEEQAAADSEDQPVMVGRAKGRKEEPTYREQARAWASASQSTARVNGMLHDACSLPPISIHTADEGWDTEPLLLGVKGGVVDLATGKFRRGDRNRDKISRSAGCGFKPGADCPMWEQRVLEIFAGDTDMVEALQTAFGYTLTGFTSAHVYFSMYGGGGTGKTTVDYILNMLLGEYSGLGSMSLLTGMGGTPHDAAVMKAKRSIHMSETRIGVFYDESLLKRYTGGGRISSPVKYVMDPIEFDATHKFWIQFNHRPQTRDHSDAFWRRHFEFEFPVKFDGAKKIEGLKERIVTEELPGILNWAMRGTAEYLQHGLRRPAKIVEAASDLEITSHPLVDFGRDAIRPDGPGFLLADAFDFYNIWAREKHVKYAFGKNTFFAHLDSWMLKFGVNRKKVGRNAPRYERGSIRYIMRGPDGR